VPFSRAVLTVWLAAGALSQTAPPPGGGQASPAPATPSTPLLIAPPPAPPGGNPATQAIDKNAPEIVQKDEPAMFKARVDMVSVPVVVRDSKGHPVGSLTKDNFQVFDRGKQQEILRFSLEKSGDLAAKAAKSSDTTIEGETAGAVPDVPERFIAYLFDDMHLPFSDLVRSRDAAGRQLAKLPKTDRAAIFTTSGQNQLDFTDDIDKLQATLLLLRNRSISNPASVAPCPDISYYMADRMVNGNDPSAISLASQEAYICLSLPTMQQAQSIAMGDARQVLSMGQQETHISLAVLKDVMRRMSGMPGQRIVVLVSPGFLTPDEYLSDESDIIDHAVKSNVVINSLDARGLWVDPMVDASQGSRASSPAFLNAKQQYDRLSASAQADVLSVMAFGTGGSFFQNNNDLDQGMRELAGAPEFHYLLAFAPQNLKLDGSFHALKVTVKTMPPMALNIQARKGYYAPRKSSNAEENAKEEIEDAVFSREEMSDLPVELHTQFFKNGDKDATLSVLCRMDPKRIQFKKADGRNINVLTVVSAVFDRNGNFMSGIEKTVNLQMKDESLAKVVAAGVMTLKTNFTVPVGSYMVRLVVRDSEGQLMSALNGAVAIQ
jgi:VWFA-related protein